MATANLGRVGFVNKGTYSGATAYKVNDVVVYNSGTYACIQANTGQAPTNTSYWQNWVANDKALDSAVVHKTGDETIAGIKSFSDGVKVQNQNVSPFSGFKNYIINGNFDIWQRGVSQTSSGYGSDDRWMNGNAGSTKTHSQVACTDTERALFNATYFSRTVVSSVGGASNYVLKQHCIENVTKLVNKTVTLSFWAKSDSNKKLGVSFEIHFGTGGTPSSQQNKIVDAVLDLTSTWQKKTITFIVPNIVGKILGTDGVHTSCLELTFWLDAGSSLASTFCTNMIQQSGTFDIAQVQLEEGSVATPFEQRPYGLELSLCQRYFWYSDESIIGMINVYPNGSQQVGTNIKFPQTMRVAPTVSVTSNNAINSYQGITKNQFSVLQTASQGGAPTITSVSASAEL